MPVDPQPVIDALITPRTTIIQDHRIAQGKDRGRRDMKRLCYHALPSPGVPVKGFAALPGDIAGGPATGVSQLDGRYRVLLPNDAGGCAQIAAPARRSKCRCQREICAPSGRPPWSRPSRGRHRSESQKPHHGTEAHHCREIQRKEHEALDSRGSARANAHQGLPVGCRPDQISDRKAPTTLHRPITAMLQAQPGGRVRGLRQEGRHIGRNEGNMKAADEKSGYQQKKGRVAQGFPQGVGDRLVADGRNRVGPAGIGGRRLAVTPSREQDRCPTTANRSALRKTVKPAKTCSGFPLLVCPLPGGSPIS